MFYSSCSVFYVTCDLSWLGFRKLLRKEMILTFAIYLFNRSRNSRLKKLDLPKYTTA